MAYKRPRHLFPAFVSNLISYHSPHNSLCFRQRWLHFPPFPKQNKLALNLRLCTGWSLCLRFFPQILTCLTPFSLFRSQLRSHLLKGTFTDLAKSQPLFSPPSCPFVPISHFIVIIVLITIWKCLLFFFLITYGTRMWYAPWTQRPCLDCHGISSLEGG